MTRSCMMRHEMEVNPFMAALTKTVLPGLAALVSRHIIGGDVIGMMYMDGNDS